MTVPVPVAYYTGEDNENVVLYDNGETYSGLPVPLEITPEGEKEISITENGTTTEDVTQYASAKITVNVPGGGTTPTGTKEISITQNGTTTEDVTDYASAEITAAVPNSYTNDDIGKVVNTSKQLVSQGTAQYTSNGVYDTTLIDEVTVAVPQPGYVKGSFTPAARTGAITFDCGKTESQINGVIVSPKNETPINNNGRNLCAYCFSKDLYYKSLVCPTNSSGSAAQTWKGWDQPAGITFNGTEITLTITTSSYGYFDVIEYEWVVW